MDWQAFSLTLQLAAWTVLLLVPCAMLIARALAWGRVPMKSGIEALIMLPLVLPPTVLGFYLLVAFSPQSAIGGTIKSIFGSAPVFSFTGILIASLIVNLPFAVQPIQRAFEGIPRNVREAAFVSGLSPWQTMRRIELPLAWPGIVSAIALTFAHTLGEFGVILLIGGSIPGETRVLSIAIYDRVQAFDIAGAGVMSAALLGFSLLSIAIVHTLARRRGTGAHGFQ
ncbi:Molybdenum transport system permease protein ModB [Hyphomicrobium sulfonivorans]|uniref:Molybdenum transport system permease n=1 Tax=Hyphomicrobium sulfonivorans TaxID=121290 RepID=A0A109BK03_HYPSL|nr:molybdate ABC transporter permease subunit [Hyphomicrobium sulfonivorans]KWT70234.1 Molybdenum transport system permease protein ModB [Hyphomicrobium sulfonivorans]